MEMAERKARLLLLIITFLICSALLFLQGREADKVVPAAFLRYSSGTTLLRLKGCFPYPGIYRFPAKAKVVTVMKLTAPALIEKITDKCSLQRVLESGDIVNAAVVDKQHIEITICRMKAKEKMLLGIPLIADEMVQSEWESLPGIGPDLAKRIMDDRQKYGDFGSLNNLQRVPGVGKKRVEALKIYFQGL
jgi:competence protein ComEA